MDSGFLVTAGGIALISAILIQWAKKSELAIFSFIGTEKNKQKANLIFSVVVAFLTSIGVGYKYDSSTGVLILSGLTAANLAHGLWHWGLQWIGQHVAYKQWIVPQELQAANIDVLNQLLDHLKIETTPVAVQSTVAAIAAKSSAPAFTGMVLK